MIVKPALKEKEIYNIKNKVKKELKRQDELKEDKSTLAEKNKNSMKNYTITGMFSAAKTSISNSFVVPFAILLGFNPTLIALLTSIPRLLGSTSQLLVNRLINLIGSRYKLLLVASYLETITWIGFLAFSIISASAAVNSPWILIILVVFDLIFVNMQSPIETSIMGEIIKDGNRGKYFGTRNTLTGMTAFLSLLGAGFLLSSISRTNPYLGFTTIYAIAMLLSGSATRFQKKITDPNPQPIKEPAVGLITFLKTAKENNFGMYAAFKAVYYFSVYIATPFFAVYMLQVLKFDYMTFTIVSSASVIASFLSIRTWGGIIDKFGSKRILTITSIAIATVPLLWLFTKDWRVITAIEAWSGIIWAGFNLSSSTFNIEAVQSKHRISFYAYHNLLNGVGIFVGTIIGSIIINFNLTFLASAFLLVFIISGILRLVSALIFLPLIQEEKIVSVKFRENKLFHNFITIRPKEGVVFEAIESSPDHIITSPGRIETAKKIIKIKNSKKENYTLTRHLPKSDFISKDNKQ